MPASRGRAGELWRSRDGSMTLLLPRRVRLSGGGVGMDHVAALGGKAGVEERGDRDEHLVHAVVV